MMILRLPFTMIKTLDYPYKNYGEISALPSDAFLLWCSTLLLTEQDLLSLPHKWKLFTWSGDSRSKEKEQR